MKVSLSALKKYIDTAASVTEIVDKLTSIGLEVEEVIDKGAELDGFVIGEIKAVEDHPNADKLHILRVSAGDEIIQIVCGAPNVYAGMKSVLARPGVLIPFSCFSPCKGI